MEKVELLNGSSYGSGEDQNKSMSSIEADRSFSEYCDENSRLMELKDDDPAEEVEDIGSLAESPPSGKNIAFVQPNNHRRSDEPTELSFEKCTLEGLFVTSLRHPYHSKFYRFQFPKTTKKNLSASTSKTPWTIPTPH